MSATPAKKIFQENEPAADEVLRKPDLRRCSGRITNDVDTLQQRLNQSITQLITSVTTLIGVFIMMLSINVWMTLCALLILPCSMFIIGKVMKHSQKYFQQQQKYLGDVKGQVEEVYAGQNIVKAFNKEEAVMATFEETNKKLYTNPAGNLSFSLA